MRIAAELGGVKTTISTTGVRGGTRGAGEHSPVSASAPSNLGQGHRVSRLGRALSTNAPSAARPLPNGEDQSVERSRPRRNPRRDRPPEWVDQCTRHDLQVQLPDARERRRPRVRSRRHHDLRRPRHARRRAQLASARRHLHQQRQAPRPQEQEVSPMSLTPCGWPDAHGRDGGSQPPVPACDQRHDLRLAEFRGPRRKIRSMKPGNRPRRIASEAVESRQNVGAVWALSGYANGKTPDNQGFFWR